MINPKMNFILIFTFFFSATAFSGEYNFQDLWYFTGYDEFYFGASQDELASLDAYKDTKLNAYVRINSYLRNQSDEVLKSDKTSEESKHIKNIDSLINFMPPLPADIILYRGMTLIWRNNKIFEIGEEYVDKAYSSTSTTFREALVYAIPNGFGIPNNPIKGVVFTLYFQTPNAFGVLIDHGEDEVLLNHGLRFRIMQKKSAKDFTHYLVQICQKEKCDTEVKDRPDVLDVWSTK